MPVNPKKVFVVHGRNWKLRDHVMAFLRAVDLSPISWGEAVKLTHVGAPYIAQVLDAALSEAQAVLVLLTGDDEVRPRSERLGNNVLEEGQILIPQPRPNVLFEAGMAFTRLADRTILVEFENIRPCNDLIGRHRIRLSNKFAHRMALIRSLQIAGCTVDLPSDQVIRSTGDFGIT